MTNRDHSVELGASYPDLDAALHHWQVPMENLRLIREVVAGLDARQGVPTRWYRTISYAGGERPGKLPRLQVSYGWLTGLTEEEARPYGGLAYVSTRARGKGNVWGIELPVHKPRTPGATPKKPVEESATFCPNCFMQLPLAGPCECEA